MKMLLKIVAVVIVLLIILAVALVFYIDVIAKRIVEESGSSAMGVPVSLDSADVGLTTAKFEMSGLRVANPEGFKTDHFMTLNQGDVNVSAKTLMEDMVELPALNLTGIDLNLERSGGKANYDVIMDNLKSHESKEPAPPGEGKRFVIRKVNVNDIKVHLDMMPIGGELTELDLKIDNVTLEDIGSESGTGVVLAQVWDVLLKAIFMAVVEKGAGIIPDDILGDLETGLKELTSLGELGVGFGVGAVEQIGDIGKQLGEGVGEGVKDVAEGAGQGLQDVGKGIGDLLGGNKKDDGGEN